MKILLEKFLNRETITYLIFGVIATVLNIVLYQLFVNALSMPVAIGNILDTIVCVLFQYVTNRIWVFRSQNKGSAAWKEFISFIAARAVTAIIDEVIMVVGVDVIVKNNVDAVNQHIAGVGVKIMANVIVIILNYIFSKVFVFKKK